MTVPSRSPWRAICCVEPARGTLPDREAQQTQQRDRLIALESISRSHTPNRSFSRRLAYTDSDCQSSHNGLAGFCDN